MMPLPLSFEKSFQVSSYDVDCEMNLSVPTLFCYLQDTALAHVNGLDIGWSFLGRLGLFWALSKMYLKVNRWPKWNENLVVKTWARPYDIFTQPRDFQVIDENNQVVISATSSWIVLSAKDGKFQKLEHFKDRLCFIPDAVAVEGAAPKVKKVEFDGRPKNYHPVLRSDLDRNHHTNNTKYLQWLLDSPQYQSFDLQNLKELAVNYVSQSRLGDKYAVLTKEFDERNFISSIVAENPYREICRIEVKG